MPLLLVASSWAADIEVGGGGVPDIQTALDTAQPGDHLQLHGPSWSGSHLVTVDELTIEPFPGDTVLLLVDDSLGGSPETDGFFHVQGVTLTVTGLEISGGGANRISKVSGGGTLKLVEVVGREGSRATSSGGALSAQESGSTLDLVDCDLHDNQAGLNGGAISVDPEALLYVTGGSMADNTASGDGGAVWCQGICSLSGVTFSDNEAADGNGGAVLIRDGSGSEVTDSRFCGNKANQGGALAVTAGGSADLTHNVFWSNTATLYGGAIYTTEPIAPSNSDFVSNEADMQGAVLYATSDVVHVWNSIVVDHDGGGDELFRGAAVTVENVLYDGNTVPTVGGGADETGNVLTDDPEFAAYAANDCEGSDLHLEATSPALGQGDGVIGIDLGAFPVVCVAADEVPGDDVDQDCDGVDLCYVDADGDGYGGTVTVPGVGATCIGAGESTFGTDCDDSTADRNPDAIEVPGDGVDTDCDGFELCPFDGDGDGYVGTTTGPSPDWTCPETEPDCDDDDPIVHPGAVEACGVDENCDGLTVPCDGGPRTSEIVGGGADPGCGCGTGSGAGGVAVLLAALLLRCRKTSGRTITHRMSISGGLDRQPGSYRRS